MSGSCFVTLRQTKSGKRYVVRYRVGGRGFPLIHAGSFGTLREAKARREFVALELAAGRSPMHSLRTLLSPPARATLAERFDAFVSSRVDVSDKTLSLYRLARERIVPLYGGRDPAELTPADIQAAIASCAELSPKTVAHYLSTWRQVLDFSDVEPNPARSRKVKLPSREQEEPRPPSTEEWERLRVYLGRRYSLAARLIEATALRSGEALALTFGDVDFGEDRLRVSRARTKRKSAGQRWLPTPAQLLDEIDATCSLEDRHHERRVFPGLSPNAFREGLYRACRDAGCASYSPHDLRHRRISLWFAHGIDAIAISRWAGHAKASMSSDVYGHVVSPGGDEWGDFWLGRYRRERLPRREETDSGERSVRSREGE